MFLLKTGACAKWRQGDQDADMRNAWLCRSRKEVGCGYEGVILRLTGLLQIVLAVLQDYRYLALKSSTTLTSETF